MEKRKMKKIKVLFLAFALVFLGACGGSSDEDKTVMMATTTSMNDSGLLDVLAPAFYEDTGIEVQWVSVGSGEAMRLARDGEATLLFAHSPAAEEELVEDGVSKGRETFMYNNFLFVGPEDLNADSLEAAVMDLYENRSYASRGDESGTHVMEQGIFEEFTDSAYPLDTIETGSGMLDTLNIANERGAFTLVDIATWLQNREDLSNLVEAFYDKAELVNYYSLHIIDNPNASEAELEHAAEFIEWVINGRGLDIIAEYGIEQFGEPVFILLNED
jgi:tungstate transport system substrate-binding protein